MNELKVSIFINEKLIGSSFYKNIIIRDDGDVFAVNLKLSKFLSEIKKIKTDEEIKFKIFLAHNQYDTIYLNLIELFEYKEYSSFEGYMYKDDFRNSIETYSAISYYIFSKWINNEHINWLNFKNEMEKFAWIRSCGRVADINNPFILQQEVILDFDLIKTVNDFYCLIGEMALGYKGYLGADINALLDCLYRIKVKYGYNINFRIKHHCRLKETGGDYLNIKYILNTLIKNNYTLEFI